MFNRRMPHWFYVVHIQPVLSIEICSHLLQIYTARRDTISSSQTRVTYEYE